MIVTDAGPEGQFAFWARCEICNWEQPGPRSATQRDAEIALTEHQAEHNKPEPGAPSQAVVSYDVTEWDIIQAQAKVLAATAFVPANYRNRPNDIIAAALYGKAVGFGVTTALSYIHVVDGKPSLSAEAMVALVRRHGHSISGTATANAAYVIGKRADTGDEMELTWDIDMAKRAGLIGKDNWKRYPESMLWARAVSQVCRMLFPDVLLGLSYVPDELDEIVPKNITGPTRQTPGPTPALGTGGEESPAQGLDEPPSSEPFAKVATPASGTQCPECNAPAGKHATKCSLR